MRPISWHSRLLPITITVIGLLFMEKAVGLAREATSQPVTQAVSQVSAPVQAVVPPVAAAQVTKIAVPPPPVPAAELQILQDLRRRRQALDEREHRLDQQEALVQSAGLKLQAKLDELTVLQQRLEQIEDARRKRDSGNWTGLVKMYEDMKPRDAAAIFNVLDLPVLLEVLDRMDEHKAAAVLSGMLPERARLATQMLAQKRTHQDPVVVPVVQMAQHD